LGGGHGFDFRDGHAVANNQQVFTILHILKQAGSMLSEFRE